VCIQPLGNVKNNLYLFKGTSEGLKHEEIINISRGEKVPAEALVDICMSTPMMKRLMIESTAISGEFSNVTPHCKNLEVLVIYMGPESSVDQYAPFAKLPNLQDLFILARKPRAPWIFFNGSKKWSRSESLKPLKMSIGGCFTNSSRSIQFTNFDSFEQLDIFDNDDSTINVSALYNLSEISDDCNSKEESLKTFTLRENVSISFDKSDGKLNFLLTQDKSDLSQFEVMWELPNIRHLLISNGGMRNENAMTRYNPISLGNLFRPNASSALRSFILNDYELDQFGAKELAKIKTIRYLLCSLTDWKSIEFITQLNNLQHVVIEVPQWCDTAATGILSLMTSSQVKSVVSCSAFRFSYTKKEQILEVHKSAGCTADMLAPLAELNRITTLLITEDPKSSSKDALNALFEAFASKKASCIEKLDISKLKITKFEDIHNITKIQTIIELKCSFLNSIGIENLAELNSLVDLKIIKTCLKQNLSVLFKDLAEKNKIQCLQITQNHLLPEEFVTVSQIRSLRRLECGFFNLEDRQALSNLADSRIEELKVFPTRNLLKLLSAFALPSTSITQLEIVDHTLHSSEIAEISQMNGLKILSVSFSDSKTAAKFKDYLQIERFIHGESLEFQSLTSLHKLDVQFRIGSKECAYLAQLESLESLKCLLYNETGLEVLANVKNLKELIIEEAEGSLCELYRAFAPKYDPGLQKLQARITCSDEIGEISKIKSLVNLSIKTKKGFKNIQIAKLVKLTELKSLNIVDSNLVSRLDTQSALMIFQSCKKLDFVSFTFTTIAHDKLVCEAYSILRTGRDSSHQPPLQLTLSKNEDHLEFYVSRKTRKHDGD